MSARVDPERHSAYNDEPGTRRFERVVLREDRYTGHRYYLFPGGCVTYAFDFSGEGRTSLAEEVSIALGFFTREQLSDDLERNTGTRL